MANRGYDQGLYHELRRRDEVGSAEAAVFRRARVEARRIVFSLVRRWRVPSDVSFCAKKAYPNVSVSIAMGGVGQGN
jgi:hypothetical protein